MRGCLASAFFVIYLEVLTIGKLDHQLNDEIRDKELRIIGSDGTQLGIMSAEEANALADAYSGGKSAPFIHGVISAAAKA